MVKQNTITDYDDTPAIDEQNESAVSDALGVSAISPAAAERYQMLRQQSAENMLTLLAARDEEYSRRQGERNTQFILDSANQLPFKPDTRYTHEQDDYYMPLGTVPMRKDVLSDVSHSFVLSGVRRGSDAGLESIDGNKLMDLSSIRATFIWIPRPTELFLALPKKVTPNGRRGKNKVEQDTIQIPHLIVGHRLIENGKYTEVILMPLVEAPEEDRYNYNPVRKKRGMPFTAKMTTEAFLRLQAIQDTLIGEGISPAEIKSIHDKESGDFVINPSTIDCVKATMRKSAIGMAMSKMPEGEDDLEEDFDLMETDTFLDRIHPEEFTRYNVLAEVHRVFAMLGCLDKFEVLKSELVQTSLKDPALKLIQD